MDNHHNLPLKRPTPPRYNLQNFEFLRPAFSDARLTRYWEAVSHKKLTKEECLKNAIRLYQINIIYCEGLYPSLHTLEISLRNSIDKSLCNQYDNVWFVCNTDFFHSSISYLEQKYNINIILPQRKHTILSQYEQEKVIASIKDVIKSDKNKFDSKKIIIEQMRNQIISNFTLGFWTTLLTQTKKETNCYLNKIFIPCIKSIFPYAKNHERTPCNIVPVLKEIQNLRNRVFHHEPVWFPNYIKPKYDNLYRVIIWINPELEIWLKHHSKIDRFLEIYGNSSKEVMSLTLKKPEINIKKLNYEDRSNE